MKLIILDYFKRWWFVMSAIFIAYFICQAFSIHGNNPRVSGYLPIPVDETINAIHNVFVFQVMMWLGFLLLWDIQRGLPRVLISMPVTAKEIGRAWWLASVAFPAIAIGTIGSLAVLIFARGTDTTAVLKNYFADWVLIVLYLGAMFGAQTFTATTVPDTFIGKTRNLLSSLLFVFVLFGFIYIQFEALTLTKLIRFFSASAILSGLGWFRSERMVLQRAGFRPAAQHSRKQPTQHKIPQGYGGLPYLAQKTFVQTTLIGLAIISWMALAMLFFHLSHGQTRAQAITSMIDGGSTPYIFVLVFSTFLIVFQLRVLRTLPISPSALTAMLVFLPIISIAAIGVIVTALVGSMAGEAVMLHAMKNFLMLGAKAAIMVTVVVWRGLDALTFFIIFLMMVSDSFITLGLTLLFHLASKTPEHPLWISLTIFSISVAVSFALTFRLLTKSSSAYRVRTMPASAWSMARR
jgi:hypothetical protein